MPKRTIVAPKTPARYTRITCDKPGETVNLTFSYKPTTRTDPIVQTHNNVRGIVHRADGSYGIINLRGERVADVMSFFDLTLVNLSRREVKNWSR